MMNKPAATLEPEMAVIADSVCLENSLIYDVCRRELMAMDRHEIIVKLCDVIGPCPSNLSKAEELFETLRYEIANYVLHHDYKSSRGVSADLLLWLDGQCNPDQAQAFRALMGRFIK